MLIRSLITAALLISLSSCAVYNNSEKVSKISKYVGSRDSSSISIDYEVIPNLEKLVEHSEIAVSGIPIEVKQVERWHDDLLFQSTLYTFEVDESIFGALEAKQITVIQMGAMDSNEMETKLILNEPYILFFNSKYFESSIVYDAAGIEQGIYQLLPNGTIYSYYDGAISTQWERQRTEQFIQSIEEIAAERPNRD